MARPLKIVSYHMAKDQAVRVPTSNQQAVDLTAIYDADDSVVNLLCNLYFIGVPAGVPVDWPVNDGMNGLYYVAENTTDWLVHLPAFTPPTLEYIGDFSRKLLLNFTGDFLWNSDPNIPPPQYQVAEVVFLRNGSEISPPVPPWWSDMYRAKAFWGTVPNVQNNPNFAIGHWAHQFALEASPGDVFALQFQDNWDHGGGLSSYTVGYLQSCSLSLTGS